MSPEILIEIFWESYFYDFVTRWHKVRMVTQQEDMVMAMILTKYAKTKQYDEPLFTVPDSSEEIFSVKSIDESGVFELNKGQYSKSFILSDVNFAGVTDMEQKSIIINFSRVLNSMSCRFSYTVANEYVDTKEFNTKILYKLRNDKKDSLREAYNRVIKNKLTDAKQGLYQTIYLTLTVSCENMKEAISSLASIEAALRSAFIQIGVNGMAGSQLIPLSINQRMQTWYNFTHAGMHTNYKFDYEKEFVLGHDWLNIVAPKQIEFYNDYFVMNGCQYGKVLYISEYPKSLESDILSELANINCTSYITVNNELLDITALKQEIGRKYASVGMKIENEKQRNRNNNDFLTDASDKLLNERDALNEFAKQVNDSDDHFFNTTILIMYLANSEEELKKLTDKISVIAGVKSIEIAPCFDKQREGINSAFIFGIQEFKRVCNFSAPHLAMFMPFKTQEINDENGCYYGINQLSQNAIFGNIKLLQSYNGLILGKTGSGKSVFAKSEIISNSVNNPGDQIIIIDPQNEYGPLASKVNGTIISFDSQKEIFVNPMDVDFENVDYAGLQEIIGEKTDFMLTLLSSCMRRNLDAEEQGIIDKVMEKVFSDNYAMRKRLNGENEKITEYSIPEYMKTESKTLPISSSLSNEEQIRSYSPTLQDIYQGLKDRHDNISDKLAAHMQIFVNGSLNLFNHRTNVDIGKQFLVFDVSGIKENLRVSAMLVMLEIVRNKIKTNFSSNLWTFLYIDEFHELLGIDSVAEFILKLWKEIRKLKGVLTGITQNMTDLINNSANSTKLSAILSNTEYFALLNQSAIDRDMLIKYLPSISPAMFNYVEGAASGTGLLKFGATAVPFDMRMSKESEIYKIVNTTEGNRNAAI